MSELEQLFERCKTNRKGLQLLKTAFVNLQDYQLASKLRDLEKEVFVETKETRKIKSDGQIISQILKLIGYNITPAESWVINEVLKTPHNEINLELIQKLNIQKENIF